MSKAKSPRTKAGSKKKSPSRRNGSKGRKTARTKRKKVPPTANLEQVPAGPGPRMQQILQADIADWRRDMFSDEEAQLRELKRIPIRNVYDSEEARKRLVGRQATSGKRRFSRSKGTAASRA